MVLPPSAAATTGDDFNRHLTSDFCVDSWPDDMTEGQAESALAAAVASWEVPLDRWGADIFDIDANLSCSFGDVHIVAVTGSEMDTPGAVAEYDSNNTTIITDDVLRFNDDADWAQSAATRTGTELSYEGVLTHEMGHGLGAFHAGSSVWSFDGEIPSMGGGAGASASEDLEDLAQDDLGTAQWIEWLAYPGLMRFFNDDPSFEQGSFGNWGKVGTEVDISSAASQNGTYSVLIGEFEHGVYITSVFDPWMGDTDPEQTADGMDPQGDNRHKLQAYTRHRKKDGTGGGITAGYRYAYISYDPTGSKLGGTLGSFNSYVQKTCYLTSGGWHTCLKGKVFDLSVDPDEETAVAFRARFLAAADPVYIDRSGARRRDP